MTKGETFSVSKALKPRVDPQWQQIFAPSGHRRQHASHCTPSMRVPQEQQTDARLGISLKQAGHCLPAVRGSETATLFIPRKSKEPKRSHCMHHSLDSIHVDARSRCHPKTLLPNNQDKIPTKQHYRNIRQLITSQSRRISDQEKKHWQIQLDHQLLPKSRRAHNNNQNW